MEELWIQGFSYEDLVLSKLLELKVILKREMPRVDKVVQEFQAEASKHAIVSRNYTRYIDIAKSIDGRNSIERCGGLGWL